MVKYTITIQKAQFDYGIDEADIINEKFIDYKSIEEEETFDYIPPGTKKVIRILYINGQFPYAKLYITKLYSTERVFINKSTHIYTYEHPEFQQLQDGNHYRRMLGAYRGN